MFVLTVTPLKKGFGLETLSYFSGAAVEAGSIISVPVRKGEVAALVLECESAQDLKAELRKSSFSLRKMSQIHSKPFLSASWMRAVKKTSEYFAVPYGSTIAALLPSIILSNPKESPLAPNSSRTLLGWEATQGSDEERISYYKSIIREEFAKKKSVFVCLSNAEELEEAREIYAKGIEKYTVVFTSKITAQKLAEQIKAIKEAKRPLLILGTSQWLFLPINNLGTIILDKEQNSGWKSLSRPFIDFKKFVQNFAVESGIRFVTGDLALNAETIWKYKKHDPYKFESLTFRAASPAKSLIVDMKKKLNESASTLLISPALINLVKEAKETGKNIFIYSTRKGLSSMTVCRDCGAEVVCNNCNSPVVLYKGKDGNIFRCHQCGEMRDALEVCKQCGSWRLLPLGVGVEKVAEELSKAIPDLSIFEVNKEKTSTKLRAKKVVEEFYKTFGGVLIGTEMAIRFLKKPVDFAAVASIDSLFAIPDYHARERIFHIILQIKALANEKFLIQTRNAERETVEFALGGNILDFYKREIKEREEMDYPPFSVFIKITSRGAKPFVKKEMTKIATIFKNYKPAIFPSTSERNGTPYAENAVIKIKTESWIDLNLLDLLRSLPPFFEIKVDPDNLL